MDISIYEECSLLANCSENQLDEAKIARFKVQFIRSQDAIAVYEDKGSGRILTALEAYKIFPPAVFQQILNKGSAVIAYSKEEPAKTLRQRRESLNLTVGQLAKALNCNTDMIERAED